MPFRVIYKTGLAVVLTTLLYGCDSMTDQERTVVEGCAGGGVLGGGLCYLIADSKKREKCILAAAGGCIAGGAVGYVISEKKKQYASTEAFMDGEIERAAALNRNAAERNEQIRRDIARLEKDSRQLKTAQATARASRSEMERQKTNIGAQLQLAENTHNELKKEYELASAIYEEEKKERSRNDTRLLQLQKEINLLERNISGIENSMKRLKRINESVS